MADWQEVLEGTELAMNASGSATERMQIKAESLEGRINILRDAWDSFVLGLGSSEFIKGIVDTLTNLVTTLDTLINKVPVLSNLIRAVLVAQGVNVLVGSFSKLISIFKDKGLNLGGLINFKDVVAGFTQSSAAATAFGTAATATAGAAGTLSFQIGALAKALFGLAMSNPVTAVIALGTAIAAVTAAVIIHNNSLGEMKEKYQELQEEAENSQAEVDSVNNELDHLNDKISELKSSGPLTIAEKGELTELQKQRAELELILATKEKIAQIDAREEGVQASKTYGKQYGDNNITIDSMADTDTRSGTMLSTDDDLNAQVVLYDRLTRAQKEAEAAGSSLSETEQEMLSNATDYLTTVLSEMEEYKSSLDAAGMQNDEYYASLSQNIDALQSRLLNTEWKQLKLSDFIDSNSLSQDLANTLNTLNQQLSDGMLSDELYKQKVTEAINSVAQDPSFLESVKQIWGDPHISSEELAQTLADTYNVAIDMAAPQIDWTSFDTMKDQIESQISDLQSGFSESISSGEDLIANAEDLNDFGAALDGVGQSIQNYNAMLDSLDNTYNSYASNVQAAIDQQEFIADNMDALTGVAEVTGAQMQQIMDDAAAVGDVVDIETGQVLSLSDLVYQNLVTNAGNTESMQQNVASYMGTVNTAGNNTINAMNFVLQAINKVKAALAGALDAASRFVTNASTTLQKVGSSFGGKLVSKFFGISESDINSAVSGLSSVASSLKSQASAIRSSIKTEQADLIKQTNAYQGALDRANAAGTRAYNNLGSGAGKAAGGAGKAKDATEDLTDALKEQYEAEKSLLEAQKEKLQAQKEALQEEKEGLKDAENAINDLLDMTMKMLKQRYQDQRDALDDEIDALEDEKDAIDDQIDAFEEKIDKQKEALELAKEEKDHQEELAEKNRAIADIQAELAEIQFDNSAEGQKRRLELLEQLNSAEKDLDDYQSDYDYDQKQSALDAELESYRQMMEERKALIDEEQEYIKQKQDELSQKIQDDYAIYLEAIQLIEGRSGEFYNQLVEWNRVYGSHLEIDETKVNIHYIVICNENHTNMQVNPKALH